MAASSLLLCTLLIMMIGSNLVASDCKGGCPPSCICLNDQCDCGKGGYYDLNEEDLSALCQAVDPTYQKPSDCVYMKWTPCPGGSKDANRPCGWYQQTKCSSKRGKREALNEMANEQPPPGQVFLSFPDES